MATTSERRRLFISVSAILIVIVIVILHVMGWLKPFESAISFIISPVQRVTYAIGNNTLSVGRKVRTIKNLYNENETLKKENSTLIADRNKLIEAEVENKSLREQLNLLPKEDYDLVGAHIIGYDPDKTNQIRIINRGSRHNVHKNDAIIVSDGLLIGKVIETYETTSKFMTIESQKSTINIKVAGKDVKGIVRGEHGIGLLLDLIPQQVDIKTDDIIMTSGLGKDYPKDLTVGVINEINKADNNIFQQAFVEPAVNPNDLKQVFIITNSQDIE